MAFGIPNPPHSKQNQTLVVCLLTQASSSPFASARVSFVQVRFSCILRTDVVSFSKLFASIFVSSTSIHGLVWLAWGSGYLMCAGPAQYFSKQVSEILLYIYLGHLGHYCHPCHLYGTIQKHWERKSAWLFYGAGHEETKIGFLVAS